MHQKGEIVFVNIKYDDCSHHFVGKIEEVRSTTMYPYRINPIQTVEGALCGCYFSSKQTYLVAESEVVSLADFHQWEV